MDEFWALLDPLGHKIFFKLFHELQDISKYNLHVKFNDYICSFRVVFTVKRAQKCHFWPFFSFFEVRLHTPSATALGPSQLNSTSSCAHFETPTLATMTKITRFSRFFTQIKTLHHNLNPFMASQGSEILVVDASVIPIIACQIWWCYLKNFCRYAHFFLKNGEVLNIL